MAVMHGDWPDNARAPVRGKDEAGTRYARSDQGETRDRGCRERQHRQVSDLAYSRNLFLARCEVTPPASR